MQKPLYIINISLLACILLVTGSCKRNCKKHGTCKPVTYKFTLEEAKDYLWAEEGSYWIYKNTNTGALDTLTCVGFAIRNYVSKGTEDYSKHVTIEFEGLSRTIYSSFHNWHESQYTGAFTANANDPTYYNILLYREADTRNNTFFYPFISGIHGDMAFTGMDSTYFLQNKTYHNVVKFEIYIDGNWENSPPYTTGVYYWAKDVGLIKRFAKSRPDNWDLIEYKIIR